MPARISAVIAVGPSFRAIHSAGVRIPQRKASSRFPKIAARILAGSAAGSANIVACLSTVYKTARPVTTRRCHSLFMALVPCICQKCKSEP